MSDATHLPGREALERATKGRPRRRNKYGVSAAADRTVDGILFASKAEMKRYVELKALRACGHVLYFLRQTPFHLPGGVRYVVDFTVFWVGGAVTFEDVKPSGGYRTSMYKMKKKQVQALYPIDITEVECPRR